MNLRETILLAFKNILSSKMRTFLTMLGIIIGVSAVILITGMGNGMQNYMADSFASLGTNTLTVMVTGRGTSRNITIDEMYGIRDNNTLHFAGISPTVTLSGVIKIGKETLDKTTATGVSEEYAGIKDYEIAQGRNLQYMDILDRKKVCVVGNYINETHFAGRALGQKIRVLGNELTIVGVMEQEAETMEEGGTDDCIFLPYSTAMRISGMNKISNYIYEIKDDELASSGKKLIENELYKIFRDSNAYTVISLAEMLDIMNTMINVMITILAIIAGISLLVGGVGIMNIMLVSVTERTREIGIRKALGAKESAIMKLFVIESASTSCVGGILGIVFGYVLSVAATVVVTSMLGVDLTVAPSLGSVLLAFGISAAIGIMFGYLPAKKAAKLNPIDALRYD